MNGWIKLHRNFVNWEWYDQPGMVWLFTKCLLLANFEDKKWHGIDIPRGSFITSYENLSNKKAKVSVMQVRTMLKRLISTGEITIKTTNKYTLISINNYESYQEDNKQSNKQITNKQQTNNKQITTTKEYKNNKNIRNIYISKFNSLETINNAKVFADIAAAFGVSPSTVSKSYEDLELYCHANGRVYKNYKAALSTFVKRKLERKQ